MTKVNPFKNLDDRCKYFHSKKGIKFYLRIITKESTFRKYPQVTELLNKLATDSEMDLNKNLMEHRGEKLITVHRPDELWQVSEEWLKSSFETSQNRTVFVVEDEEGNALSTSIMMIDSEIDRKKMRVPDDIGTFVYLGQAVTREDFKGFGLLSATINKTMTMLKNPKREEDVIEPVAYSISVSVAKSVKIEGDNKEVFNHVMNLPLYTGMWQRRFEKNNLQMRWQDIITEKQEGRERYPLPIFIKENSLNEDYVDALIKTQEPKAIEKGKWVRGLYLEGIHTMNHQESVEFRKNTINKSNKIIC